MFATFPPLIRPPWTVIDALPLLEFSSRPPDAMVRVSDGRLIGMTASTFAAGLRPASEFTVRAATGRTVAVTERLFAEFAFAGIWAAGMAVVEKGISGAAYAG